MQERLHDTVSEFSRKIKTLHPEKFIKQLDIYFNNVPSSPIQQLNSAERQLVGGALICYESLIPPLETYIEFRDIFR